MATALPLAVLALHTQAGGSPESQVASTARAARPSRRSQGERASHAKSRDRVDPAEQVDRLEQVYLETVAALAKFFKVKPDYFFNDIYAAKIDHDLELLSQLQGYGLRRLSSRAFDLSEESQNLLTSMAEKLRASEGLPEIPPDGTE